MEEHEVYSKVWDILVEHVGASPNERCKEAFVQAMLNKDRLYFVREYRFMGIFGYGGKLWRDNGRLFVSYYPEDHTPERDALVKHVNELLKAYTV